MMWYYSISLNPFLKRLEPRTKIVVIAYIIAGIARTRQCGFLYAYVERVIFKCTRGHIVLSLSMVNRDPYVSEFEILLFIYGANTYRYIPFSSLMCKGIRSAVFLSHTLLLSTA